MSFFDRMESCRLPGESMNRFCKRMNIAIRQYQDIRNGGFVRHGTLVKMAEGLDVSPMWLETGRGPKDLKRYEEMLNAWETDHDCQCSECKCGGAA